jgi:hypothetical protein
MRSEGDWDRLMGQMWSGTVVVHFIGAEDSVLCWSFISYCANCYNYQLELECILVCVWPVCDSAMCWGSLSGCSGFRRIIPVSINDNLRSYLRTRAFIQWEMARNGIVTVGGCRTRFWDQNLVTYASEYLLSGKWRAIELWLQEGAGGWGSRF